MGVPHAREALSVICVVLDAPEEKTGELARRLAALAGVKVDRMRG